MVCIYYNRVMFHHIGYVPKQVALSMVRLALIGIGIIDYIGISMPICIIAFPDFNVFLLFAEHFHFLRLLLINPLYIILTLTRKDAIL